ncbi:MAG: phosphate ABC transporter ATP-binding protein PstB [Clostridiales bacterium]|nr:phosphate ABC transporter ATP-binding protein PstB [Clostridiales bacterium]
MDINVAELKHNVKIKAQEVDLYYGSHHALESISIDIYERSITAIIGPSGCGKSTLLRIFNRMNDLIPNVKVTGKVLLDSTSIYDADIDVAGLRKKVGMVFQRPNVFPMSIFDNITIGPRHHGITNKRELTDIVERSLSQVALFDEVKDHLNKPALDLLAGQQQRLCIARALAVEPEVVLMDESCSALDPESTMRIEDLMMEMAKKYTIIIVTHNMEQAARVSDMAAFIMINDSKVGTIVEYTSTTQMFANPKDQRTEDYITGRFG